MKAVEEDSKPFGFVHDGWEYNVVCEEIGDGEVSEPIPQGADDEDEDIDF